MGRRTGTGSTGSTARPGSRGNKPARRPRKSARQRILEAATDLFYRQGIRAVGVDAIIQEAGVAKATFYNHFPSKDDAIVAWLREPNVRWLNWVREEVERRATSPAERLLVFFDVLEELFGKKGFRGCPYLNTAAEVPDARHPARREVLHFQLELEDYLRELAEAAGLPEADGLASGLVLLVVGAWATAVIRGSATPAAFARAAADRLLATARPGGLPGSRVFQARRSSFRSRA